MKVHEDIYMWRTIEFVTSCSDEIREKIYNRLFGKVWTIAAIEQLEQKFLIADK